MDYQLAKALKDAGFESLEFVFDGTDTAWHPPTLEELIEAIPNDLKLQRIRHDKPESVVTALHTGAPFAVGRGNTLLEATAYCWLALNSKV